MRAQACSGPRQAADVRAARLATRTRHSAASLAYLRIVPALIPFLAASPASSQVAVAASILSDDRFRGYSLSNDHPVAILDLSYDAADGSYGAVSGSVVADHEGIRPLGFQLNGGYAKRLTPGLTIDVGAIHSDYSRYSSRGRRKDYTEAYVGLAGKLLSTRISVSPDYLKPGMWTLYGELNGNVPAGSKMRFTAHLGVLKPLRRNNYGEYFRTALDWRVGVARDIGRLTLTASWTGVHRDHDIYQERRPSHHAFVVGASCAF